MQRKGTKSAGHLGRQAAVRSGFTLAELLISISIIVLLATMLIVALAKVQDDSRAARTRSQIARIHTLLMARWDSYRTRPLRLNIAGIGALRPEPWQDTNGNGQWDPGEFNDQNGNGVYDLNIAGARLAALRELMRMELPDRVMDVIAYPNPQLGSVPVWSAPPPWRGGPSLWWAYRRRALAAGTNWVSPGPDGAWGTAADDDGDGNVSNPEEMGWPGSDDEPANTVHQGAECLYLILSMIQVEGRTGLDFFKSTEIGDTDGDGMPEILDGFGNPIEFVRWPAGYLPSPLHDTSVADPFDPFQVDPRWEDDPAYPDNNPFALFPLVFSAGPDERYDIATDNGPVDPTGTLPAGTTALRYPTYSTTSLPIDPYMSLVDSGGADVGRVGYRGDIDGDGNKGYADNIDNHFGVNQ